MRSTFLKKQLTLLALIFGLTLLSFGAACQTAQPDLLAPKTVAAEQREITDDLGRRVLIPAKIERVISLAPSITENVFAIGAGAKLVGVTSYCDYPAEATKINKVGDTLKPNLETIIALKPQLILVSTDSQLEAFFRNLETQKIAIFVTDAKSFADAVRNLRQIGDLLGTAETAEKLAAELEERAAAVEEKVKNQSPPRVFFQLSREPLFTVGRDSFITNLIERAGGASITAEVPEAYPKLSKETVLMSQPEIIVLPVNDSMGAANVEISDALRDSPAAKNNRIYKINGDTLARPGPRLVDGLEAMAKVFHPNVFAERSN